MEKNNKEKNEILCDCSNCGVHGSYHRFFWLRWFLVLLILAMVFCVGIKIGEFKGYFDASLGRSAYMGDHHMEYGRYPALNPIPSTSATAPATTKAK